MKILIVSPAFPPFSGVGAIRMNSLSKYLRDIGEQVIVLRNTPLSWGEQNLKAEVPEGIEIIDVDTSTKFNENSEIYTNKIIEICEKHSIDTIIYSVGPFYTVKVAPKIKKLLGVNYIIDFRDLWVYEYKGKKNIFKKIKNELLMYPNRFIEKEAVKSADYVVVVTNGDKRKMGKYYRNESDKIKTIFNGYEYLSESYYEKQENNKITLAALGKLGYYSKELLSLLFESIGELVESGVEININHIGEIESNVGVLLKTNNLPSSIYDCSGFVSYEDGMKMTKESDIGLIIATHPTALGTKVFDYISCNKPILFITSEAEELSKFIRNFDYGFICKSKEDIIETINYIVKNNITKLDNDNNKIRQYSRKYQNEKYYNLVKKVVFGG
ncbi:glycosyltransferase [Halobacillus seohaensis]|uniref:Glycosyltransferase n=1 Tax=Halobacillus seohaensis TaxID=447421 RepID=A0ABW2EJ84_9BACI